MHSNGTMRHWSLGTMLGALLLGAAPDAHAIVTVGTISTPTPDSRPTATAVAPDGTVWFTEEAANKLGYIDANNGVINEYTWTSNSVRPNALAIDSSGRIWFTEANTDTIGMYDPTINYLAEYNWGDSNLGLSGIEVTPDGKLWFTMFNRDEIGVLDPSLLTINYYYWTSNPVGPLRIKKDSANRLWFTENTGNRVGVLDPYWNYVYDYYFTGDGSSPWGIAVDSNQYVWFTDNQAGIFSQLDPNTGSISDWQTLGGASSAPRDLTTTTNAASQTIVVWTESGGSGNIGVLNAATGDIMGVPLSPSSEATGIAIDTQENVWFTETGLSEVGGFGLPSTSIARRPASPGPARSLTTALGCDPSSHLVLTKNDNGKRQNKGKFRDRLAKIEKKQAKVRKLRVKEVKSYRPTKKSKKYR